MSGLTPAPMLATHVAGLDWASPILNASGTFNPAVFGQIYPLASALGAIVTKTVTPAPKPGNPPPRTVELPGIGMLNSIGLQNPGLDVTLDEELPILAAHAVPIVLSLSAPSAEAFGAMARQVAAHANARPVRALELNLSCPNVHAGGLTFGTDPQSVAGAVAAVRVAWDGPLFAKLTPNVTDLRPIAEAALTAGASGLTAINTVVGMAIDVRRRRAILPRVSGGYSGPGVKPIALHAVWQLRQAFPGTPIIGVGGLSSATDVLEFLMAGASLVQVGTSCFRDPMVFQSLVTELTSFCEAEGVCQLADLVGCAHP